MSFVPFFRCSGVKVRIRAGQEGCECSRRALGVVELSLTRSLVQHEAVAVRLRYTALVWHQACPSR